jgi:hypothetical protein
VYSGYAEVYRVRLVAEAGYVDGALEVIIGAADLDEARVIDALLIDEQIRAVVADLRDVRTERCVTVVPFLEIM